MPQHILAGFWVIWFNAHLSFDIAESPHRNSTERNHMANMHQCLKGVHVTTSGCRYMWGTASYNVNELAAGNAHKGPTAWVQANAAGMHSLPANYCREDEHVWVQYVAGRIICCKAPTTWLLHVANKAGCSRYRCRCYSGGGCQLSALYQVWMAGNAAS